MFSPLSRYERERVFEIDPSYEWRLISVQLSEKISAVGSSAHSRGKGMLNFLRDVCSENPFLAVVMVAIVASAAVEITAIIVLHHTVTF